MDFELLEIHAVSSWPLSLYSWNVLILCTVSEKTTKKTAVWINLWVWRESMCPCLAGVGCSRERAMPQGLHLPFGSCARRLLDPLRATLSHRLIWQHGCDHWCGDGWAAAAFLSVVLKNQMSNNKPLALLFQVYHCDFFPWTKLNTRYNFGCSHTQAERLWCVYYIYLIGLKCEPLFD